VNKKLTKRIAIGTGTLLVLGAVMSGVSLGVEHRTQTRVSQPVPVWHEPGRTFTLAASGDIMVHPPTWQQARKDAKNEGHAGYDFDPMLTKIAPRIKAADLGICHMEIPMAAGEPKDFPHFSAPTEMAQTIKRAGYDACSTSSNHALDMGETGLLSTINTLDAAGIKHTGTFRTKKESETPTIYTVKGVKVGHLSWAMHFNEDKGNRLPVGKEWMANKVSIPKILAAAKATRKAGAEVIILSLHAGTEGQHEPDVQQDRWISQLVASPDIDLILGHHAHVVQPIQKINGKWVVFGMGNTLARHDFPNDGNREGIIAQFTFTETSPHKFAVTRAEASPTWLSLKPNIKVLDLANSVGQLGKLDRRRNDYQKHYDEIAKYVFMRGAARDGLVFTKP
jgi:hypothetical protein